MMVTLAGIFLFIQIKRATQITVKKNPVALISLTPTFIPTSEKELILGNPGAPITIVEFMDLDCDKCISLHNTIKTFVNKNPQDMRLIWKDAPQQHLFSEDLTLAHQAGWCIAQQDEKKFWQFIDAAGQNNNDLQETGLKKIGQKLDLAIDSWWQCATGPAAQQQIARSVQIANAVGAQSLPAIFVNNKRINTDADINIADMLQSFIAE
jgi:protein-disulfide isomerase